MHEVLKLDVERSALPSSPAQTYSTGGFAMSRGHIFIWGAHATLRVRFGVRAE
jgi:hypothetical protein